MGEMGEIKNEHDGVDFSCGKKLPIKTCGSPPGPCSRYVHPALVRSCPSANSAFLSMKLPTKSKTFILEGFVDPPMMPIVPNFSDQDLLHFLVRCGKDLRNICSFYT